MPHGPRNYCCKTFNGAYEVLHAFPPTLNRPPWQGSHTGAFKTDASLIDKGRMRQDKIQGLVPPDLDSYRF